MSKGNNTGVNLPNTEASVGTASQGSQHNEAPQHGTADRNFFSSARRTARSVSPAPLNALFAAMKDRVASEQALKELRVLSYSGMKDNSNLSGVAAYSVINNNIIMMFVSSAASCELTPREVPVDNQANGRKVTMPTTVADLYHARTIKCIKRDIYQQLGKAAANYAFHNAGHLVMHLSHNEPNFVDEAGHFANVAWDAICDYAAHSRIINEELFNVKVLSGAAPRANVACQPSQVFTLTGEPRRADITVTTNVQTQGPEGMVATELTRTAAFMNFIYRKPQSEWINGQQVTPTQYFKPEIVITDATALNHANTLESILYSIYAIDAAIDQHRWLNMYKINHGGSGKNAVNPYNLGALNVDLPATGNKEIDGKVIPTGDPAWIDEGLYVFASRYLTPTIGKAIIIPETGPQARLLGLFHAAAVHPGMTPEQLQHADRARHIIIRAADNLTGNNFSKHIGGAPLFLPLVERSLIGSFVEDGEQRDINYVDNVSLLNNHAGNDLDFVYKFEETFTDTREHEAIRLNNRIACVKQAKGSTTSVKEFGYKLRFSPQFQLALAKAIADNKINVHIDGVGSVEAQPERGAGYLDLDYGLSSNDVQGFSAGGNGGVGSSYAGAYQW